MPSKETKKTKRKGSNDQNKKTGRRSRSKKSKVVTAQARLSRALMHFKHGMTGFFPTLGYPRGSGEVRAIYLQMSEAQQTARGIKCLAAYNVSPDGTVGKRIIKHKRKGKKPTKERYATVTLNRNGTWGW